MDQGPAEWASAYVTAVRANQDQEATLVFYWGKQSFFGNIILKKKLD